MKKRTIVTLAVMLSLSACGILPYPPSPSLSPEDHLVVDAGYKGGRAIAITLSAVATGGYTNQALVHRWVDNDIYQYEVILKVFDGANFVDLTPALMVVVPRKGPSPKNKVAFTNLKHGKRYQVSVVAKGNPGGTAPAQILNATPSSAQFDFTASQDVEDTLSTTVQVALDPVTFNGTGTINAQTPSDGNFLAPANPEQGMAISGFLGIVTTLAGGTDGTADGLGTSAQFNNPRGIDVDAQGNIYVADQSNHRIRKISPGGLVTTLAGSSQGFAEGSGSAAQFNTPMGVAVDLAGNVYVADESNHRIRKITPGGLVSTFAGSGVPGYAEGNGSVAQFTSPRGVAVDAGGNVYVADLGNHRIRKITAAGTVSTLAGNGFLGFNDGPGTTAMFNQPIGVAVDTTGNVYVADLGNDRIRKVTPAGMVSSMAGSSEGYVDDTGVAARFHNPYGVEVDADGNVYVADIDNNKIRRVTPGGVVTTVAGSTLGFADGPAGTAKFQHPTGVALDSNGNLYVCDFHNSRVRKIQ